MTDRVLNIGEAAAMSGVSAKMIRYYESIGLIPPPVRSGSGYRHYCASEVHTLRFIRRARDLGFSVEAITRLVALWHDRSRASAEVKELAMEHVAELRRKLVEISEMLQTLEHLAAHCHGDNRPDCPIIEDLAKTEPPAAALRAVPARKGNLSGRRTGTPAADRL